MNNYLIINEQILNFRNFIVSSWESLSTILKSYEFAEDRLMENWFQANWELLVEQQVAPKNSSITCYSLSKVGRRWSSIEKKPVYCVICVNKSMVFDQNDVILFRSFIAEQDDCYGTFLPFDVVYCYSFKQHCMMKIPLHQVDFYLIEVPDDIKDKLYSLEK